MSISPRTEERPGESWPKALCRGCDAAIWRLPGAAAQEVWEDADGVNVCVKAGEVPASGYVFHQPMPAGLRGAPE